MAKGLSLHIGLNSVNPKNYAGWSGPLAACELDASDMQAIAKFNGFKPKVLLTKKATRKTVQTALASAAAALKAGDMFFLSYSGHGGMVPDRNNDESDGQDETWCLYDGEMLDDELNYLYSRFRAGVRILVLSDSCHSGTVTRNRLAEAMAINTPGPARVYRAMPRDQAISTYMAHQEFYDNIQTRAELKAPDIKASVLLISGCQDSQLSLDGTFNGLFTGTLKSVWNGGTFKGGYKKLHKSIVNQMPSDQTPNYFFTGGANKEFEEQKPFSIQLQE